jgi:cytoplasmic iron level regulating protein YaaA (DUF328/UPF0246 family)
MNLKEKIALEKVFEKEYKSKLAEPANNKEAVITHYLHNSKNGLLKMILAFPKRCRSYFSTFLFIPRKGFPLQYLTKNF